METPTSKRFRLECAPSAPLAILYRHTYSDPFTTMSLPAYSPLTSARPTTRAQAVAQARHPRNHATAQLEPHREELLRLHEAGDSVESLAGGLRLIGIEIGRETMRRWLLQESGRKPTKRRKRMSLATPKPDLVAGSAASTRGASDKLSITTS